MHVTVSVPLQKESSLPKLHRSPQLPNIDLPNIDLPNIDWVEIPALRQTAPCQFFRDSCSVYLWLREQQFDVICFPMRGGIGFHSLVAQAQGLAFPRTLLCVVAETPSLQNRLAQHELLSGLAPLRLDFMERTACLLSEYSVRLFPNPPATTTEHSGQTPFPTLRFRTESWRKRSLQPAVICRW